MSRSQAADAGRGSAAALLWAFAGLCLASESLASGSGSPEPGPTPIPVVLSIEEIQISSIRLTWTQSLDPRLDRYELWREGPVVGTRDGVQSLWLWVVLLAGSIGLKKGRQQKRAERAVIAGAIAMLLLSGATQATQNRSIDQMLIYSGQEREDTEFRDTAVEPDADYSYQVRVLTSDGLMSESNISDGRPLALPTPTPTRTPLPPPPTSTSTRTATPCPEIQRLRVVQDLGRYNKPFEVFDIEDHVVETTPITIKVSGSLCWSNDACGFTTVGPGGVDPIICDDGDCDHDPRPERNHAAFFFERNGVLGGFATKEAPGASEQFNLPELQKGDTIRLTVNDGNPENNTLGFTVELRYLHRSCQP